MKLFVLWVALLSLSIQPPTPFPDGPDDQLPEVERRIPAGHYCKRPDVTIRPSETMAHHCECRYSCTVDSEGNVTDHETETCLAYCHKNNRRCSCWPEGDPSVDCAKPGSNALMDMDGHVVAIYR